MKLLLIAYFFVLSSICEPCKVGDEYNDQTEASNQAGWWYLNVNVPANCSGSISGYKIKYYNINLQASFQYRVNIYIWKPIGGVSYEKDSSTRVVDYFSGSNKRRRKKSTDERTPDLLAPVGIRKGSVIGVYLYNFILIAAMPVIGNSSNSIINNIPIGVCKSSNVFATTVDCTNASYYSNLLLHAEADINIVDCGSPPNIDNANFMLLDGDTQYGATVQYNCNIGYTLTGNDNITCQLNGSWTTPLLSCNIVDCNDPGTPDNGEVVGSVFTYNASVIFLCGTGYELHGNKTATCQANGQWNIALPICKIVNCSDPGIPSNGNKIGNAYSYNSSIYYFCDTGYNLTGNNKLTCSANGSWDKTVPTCEIISCDNPGTPSNGYKTGSVYSYNSSIPFFCNTGYNLMGSSILTCLANGSWDVEVPSCYIVDCGDPGTPNNGQRNGLNYTYGSHVTFSCQKGYVISSNVTLQCLANGSWNGSLPTCTLISCGNPGTPVHGIRHGDSFDFQDVVSFSCESELSLIGNANITCQSNGLWSDSLPMCSHLDCNDPGIPDNGQQHGSNFSYGASISFTCNIGYEISGNSIIECEVEGKWNGTIPICNIIYCNNPGAPVNGSASPSNFTYGSVVTFYCDIGLEVAGNTNIKCQANGIWNDTLPVCTLVTCPNPVPPTNGYIEGNSNTFSSIITFHCNPSYHLEGNTSAQCQANKVWSAIAPTCLKLCNDPGIPNNGSRLPSNPPLLTEGVDFTFDCFAGYRLLGPSSITCLSSGQWSQLTPQCVRVCSDPGTPDHGSQNPKSSFYIEGSVINFQCDNNYELSGATNLTCLSGKWNNVIPQCIGTTFTITDTTKAETLTLIYTPTTSSVLPTDQDEAINKFGIIIGAIMSAFLFVLGLLFIIMLVVLLIWRSHKHSGKLVVNLEDKSHEMSTITNPMMFISELYDSTSPKSLDEATPYEVPVQTLHNQFANKPKNTNMNDIESDLIENNLTSPLYFALDQCESTEDTSIKGGIPQPLYFTLEGDIVCPQPVYFTLEQTDSNKNMAANISQLHQPVYFTLEEPKHITSDQLQGDINQPLYFTLNQKSKRTTLIYQEPCDSEDELYGQIKKSPVASISLDALQLGNAIGSGQFGNVRSAVWLKDDGQNIEVALKTLQEGATKQEKIKFLQEAFIMSQFNHSNVIKLHGVVIDENSPMIVVEYMPKGDLHGVLHKIRPDPGELINSDNPILLLNFCRQICLGMTYLSEKGFVHRDLAARNILVSADNICKIIDFGLSRDLEDENYYVSRKGAMIPVKWTAPEALNYRKYSTASDVWSYGCLMYEIWSLGHKPYENLSNLQALQKICGGYRLPPPPGCSEAIYNLMMSCWHPIPRERPSFDDVMLILLQNDETLLTMPEDALSSHPQAGVLGGILKAGELMYLKIQSKYTDFIDTSF